MKLNIVLICLFTFSAAAAVPDENPDIQACLKAWGKHPFKKSGNTYRTIRASVKVMGIGGDMRDIGITSEPELILVKPGVSVMAKQTFELLNPKGWYCMKGTVTVLGKAEITTHCQTHIASSDDGVAIAAIDDERAGGVSVLSKVELKRVGCKK